MTPETIAEKVQYLLDRAEITDVIGKYALGMDTRDWELYRSVWTDEVVLDFSELELYDKPFEAMRAEDWVRALRAFFADMPQSQHVKVPVSFAIDGDRAVVLAIMQGKHWMPTPTGGPMQTVVGYYRDELVRTSEGWKIHSLKELVHWNEGNAHVLDANLEKLFEVLREVNSGVV